MYFSFIKDNENINKEYVADVIDKVMCKEVYVNERGKKPKMKVGREIFVSQLKKIEGSGDITSYSRVEEAGEERYSAERKESVFQIWVTP